MIKFTLAAIMMATMATAAHAQVADLAEDSRLVRSVKLVDIQAVVTASGHTITSSDADSVLVSAQVPEGIRYVLRGTACDGGQTCQGINMVISYDMPNGIDDGRLNQADVTFAAASVWRSNNNIGVSRYVILDGGMTMENIKINLQTLISIAPQVFEKVRDADEETVTAAPLPTGELAYGDDEGDYANDGECDDARFHSDGGNAVYKRAHVMHDATDCQRAVEASEISLVLDFGDNLGEYADDNTCDDVRFEGDGRSVLTTDSHIGKDSADCIAAFQDGTISLK